MPVYEFECRDCGERFDKRKDLENRDEPESCPLCGGKADRVFTPFAGVLWKGAFDERPVNPAEL